MRFVGALIVIIVAVAIVAVFMIVRMRTPTPKVASPPRELVWDPSPGAEWYTVKCGTERGRYTLPSVVVKAPSTSVALESITGGSGTYFCVVTASNRNGESAPSSEIALAR